MIIVNLHRSWTCNVIVSLWSILHLSSPKVDLSTSWRNGQDAIEFTRQLLSITTCILCPAHNFAINWICITFKSINGFFNKTIRLPPAHPRGRYICPHFDDLLMTHFMHNQTVCLLTYLLKHCCTWSRNDFSKFAHVS